MAAEPKTLPLEFWGLALSIALATFGAWGWLHQAGVWTGEMSPASPGYALLAVLCVIVQIASNQVAAAARRTRERKLHGSHRWSVRLMLAGGAFNAVNIHHAWECTGMFPPLWPLSIETTLANIPILALSIVLAVFEPALYWIHDALLSHDAKARDAEMKAAVERASVADQASGARRLEAWGAAALASAGASAMVMPAAANAPVEHVEPYGRTIDLPRHNRRVEPADKERVLALLLETDVMGERRHELQEIARRTGLSRYQVRRIKQEYERALVSAGETAAA